MALNISPKVASTPQAAAPTARPQINYGTPKPTTARVEALKQRLTQPAQSNPVAPRPAGSTARAEQYAELQKAKAPAPVQAKTTARAEPEDLSKLAPPPSGLVNPSEPVAEINNSVEAPKAAVEASNEPLSPQFVALAKQEQIIRKARRELDAEKAAWKQAQAKFINADEFKADPLKYLNEHGITNDRLVELQLNQASPDPNQALQLKIQELEAKLAGVDEKFKTRDTQSYEAAVNQIRSDAKLLVDSDPAFETIKSEGATEDVVELIKRVFDKEGTILSVEEAAKSVEDALVEREFKRLQRLQQLSKIKSRLGTPAETPAEAQMVQQPTKTLTNQSAVQKPLSARERAVQAVERRMAGLE